MITYEVEGTHYTLSYQELKDKYYEMKMLSDADFLSRIPEALHLACVILWLKEAPSYVVLSDKGIIHELVHLLHIPDAAEPIAKIREHFNLWLELN